jgi:hypothetical protein
MLHPLNHLHRISQHIADPVSGFIGNTAERGVIGGISASFFCSRKTDLDTAVGIFDDDAQTKLCFTVTDPALSGYKWR